MITSASNALALSDASSTGVENGVLFNRDDESTFPPEYTFVVTNLLPNVPVYYDRAEGAWWTAVVDKNAPDIYSRDDIYYRGLDSMELYWQPIAFKKADVLFIPADDKNSD